MSYWLKSVQQQRIQHYCFIICSWFPSLMWLIVLIPMHFMTDRTVFDIFHLLLRNGKGTHRYLPKINETFACKNVYTGTFVAALLIISKHWIQSKYSSTYESITQLWYIHAVEYTQPSGSISKTISYIEVKFIEYKIHHFKVNNSLAFSTELKDMYEHLPPLCSSKTFSLLQKEAHFH